MPKLAPSVQQARREAILDSAERCFVHKGFRTATMDDVCRAASVSAGALYGYFSSKEDLIGGLCKRESDRYGEQVAEVGEAPDFLEALQAMAEHFCCQEPLEKALLHVEIRSEAGRNQRIRDSVQQGDAAFRDRFTRLLEQERKRGGIEPTLPVSVIVHAISALGDGLFCRRVLDPTFDHRPVVAAIMTMITALLRPVSVSSAEPE